MDRTQWIVGISADIDFAEDIGRLIASEIDAAITRAPCTSQEAFAAVARRCDAIAVGDFPITSVIVDQLERCRVLARTGVGVDNIDLAAAQRRQVRVTNIPDYGMEDVASHALMLLLMLARRTKSFERALRSGDWSGAGTGSIHRVHGHTIGILGLGRIGKTFARQVSGLGCRVIANDPYVDREVFLSNGVQEVDFPTLIESSDFLSLHVPLTGETHHIIGGGELARMKPTAFLVNTARGAVVDQRALVTALQSGQIAGAGLDVFEEEPINTDDRLLQLDNVILTPHVAWCSEESRQIMAQRTCEEIVCALSGQPARCPVVDP
jgi:D-3-phosphoglycerate dehydrogenase